MPRSSFAKVVRNRREDLPEGVRPWQVPEVVVPAPKVAKKKSAATLKKEAKARVAKRYAAKAAT